MANLWAAGLRSLRLKGLALATSILAMPFVLGLPSASAGSDTPKERPIQEMKLVTPVSTIGVTPAVYVGQYTCTPSGGGSISRCFLL